MKIAYQILVVGAAIFLAGCSNLDRVNTTSFAPLRSDALQEVYLFTANADVVRPLDSSEAEKTRMEWLQTWMKDNGLAGKSYTILSRKAVLRNTGVFGGAVYDVYYEVSIKK